MFNAQKLSKSESINLIRSHQIISSGCAFKTKQYIMALEFHFVIHSLIPSFLLFEYALIKIILYKVYCILIVSKWYFGATDWCQWSNLLYIFCKRYFLFVSNF